MIEIGMPNHLSCVSKIYLHRMTVNAVLFHIKPVDNNALHIETVQPRRQPERSFLAISFDLVRSGVAPPLIIRRSAQQ